MKITSMSLSRYQSFLLGYICVFFLFGMALKSVIGPLFLALILTYVIAPFINKLESRGFKRSFVAWILVILGLILLCFAVWGIAPLLFDETKALLNQIPNFIKYIDDKIFPIVSKKLAEFIGAKNRDSSLLVFWENLKTVVIPSTDVLLSSINKSKNVLVSVIFMLVLTPFFTFFMIKYKTLFLSQARMFIPLDLRPKIFSLLVEFDKTLRAVLRGQLLLVTLLSMLYGSAFALAGMPLGFAVGFITGVVRLVPYMDIVVGGTLSFLILATTPQSYSTVIAVVGCFMSIQIFDLVYLTPRVFARASGLHPFIIILAVLCFGDWFGFFGVVLAIPLAALGRVVLKRSLLAYKMSRFYRINDLGESQNYRRR